MHDGDIAFLAPSHPREREASPGGCVPLLLHGSLHIVLHFISAPPSAACLTLLFVSERYVPWVGSRETRMGRGIGWTSVICREPQA